MQHIVDALDDKRAVDIRVLDLKQVSETLEYFIIATGESNLQLKAMQDNVKDELRNKGVLPRSIEGPSEHWILMDYGNMLVHLMSPTARGFYDLEGLWADAKVLHIEPTPIAITPV